MKKPSVELRLPILPNMELIATQTAEVISRHMNLTEDQGAEISMALIEACINAFEHSKAENNVFINFLIEDDSLVIISDGLPEAPNLAGELFDYQKLQDLITTYGNKTAQEVIDQLMIEADAWLSGNHNPDDITLVVIKHK